MSPGGQFRMSLDTMALRDLAGLDRLGRAGFKPVLLPDAWRRAGTQPAVPAGRTPGRLRLSVSGRNRGAARRRGRQGRRRRRPRAARRSGSRPGTRAAGCARPRIQPAGCGAGRGHRPTAGAVPGGPWGAGRSGRARPALWRSRYRCWRSAFVMPMRAILHRYITGSSTASLATARGGRGPRSGRTAILQPGWSLVSPRPHRGRNQPSIPISSRCTCLCCLLPRRAGTALRRLFPAFLGLLLSARASGPARSE